MKVFIHSYTSTVSTLKFRKGYVISLTLHWACEYISILGLNLNQVGKLFHNTWKAPKLGFRDLVNSLTVYQWQWICNMNYVGNSVTAYHRWCGANISFLNKLYHKGNAYCLRPRKWDTAKTYFGSSSAAAKHLTGVGEGTLARITQLSPV